MEPNGPNFRLERIVVVVFVIIVIVVVVVALLYKADVWERLKADQRSFFLSLLVASYFW